METIHLEKDLNLLTREVKTFPEGIQEAFDLLLEALPGGPERPTYGISYMTGNCRIIYSVAAEEKEAGESKKYNCEQYTLPQGKYVAVTIMDWRNKIDSIKEVFHELMEDKNTAPESHCIEWYKSDEELVCMMKAKHS